MTRNSALLMTLQGSQLCWMSQMFVLFLRVTPSFMSADRLACLNERVKSYDSVGCLVDNRFKSCFIPSPKFKTFKHIITSMDFFNVKLNFVSLYRSKTFPMANSSKIFFHLLVPYSTPPWSVGISTSTWNLFILIYKTWMKSCQTTASFNMSVFLLINSAMSCNSLIWI